jgi:F420-0:gamma-glutamyl ligase
LLLGMIVFDSHVTPMHPATVGSATRVSGLLPIGDPRAVPDIHRRKARIAQRKIADDLAS